MKKSYDMYSPHFSNVVYDINTPNHTGSDYDMYSGSDSVCGEDHIHVGPLVIEPCFHDDKCHIKVFNQETGEVVAETELSGHGMEEHFKSISENMEKISEAYHKDHAMAKAEKPFHGYNSKKHSKSGGLNDSYRKKVNRETGSNLKRPVTGKVAPGSKAAKRRKSFCARMSGTSGPTSKDGKLTPKGAALKRWKCSKSEEMNKSEKLKNFMTKVENKKLIHYSPVQGLKNIDPAKSGTGVDARARRSTEHPHSFFYKENAPTEKMFVDSAKSKYTIQVPHDYPIYDIGADHLGLKTKAIQENGGAFNKDLMFQKIKENGYMGFHDPQHHVEEMKSVVALFHPQEVSQEENKG